MAQFTDSLFWTWSGRQFSLHHLAEGSSMTSYGCGLWKMGLKVRSFVFDYSIVLHPYLNSQFRGSLGVQR